jgi:2-keto-4-pentenoate hydratase/2-oxohepta-3-ene-1,7-dioic acid hydratase in catechol pathway
VDQRDVYSGISVLNPGDSTSKTEYIRTLLSPLSASEVGTIRCIGLNYAQHAQEAKMAIPTIPTVFLKPNTSLADPFPAPTIIPKHALKDDCCDFESELTIVIGKSCKDVSEAEALDYVLGYTAANDVSSRASQFAQSQWSYSKGFDGACPIGKKNYIMV